MKPFNLQDAIDGKPIVTSDGRKVKFIAYEPDAFDQEQVIVAINKEICLCKINGTSLMPKLDLMMAPQKKQYWVNLYDDFHMSTWYDSQEEADQEAAHDRLGNKAFLIEVEED